MLGVFRSQALLGRRFGRYDRRVVAIVFDTLEYAGRLKRAGFTEQQAEAQVKALAAIVNDDLATKQDMVLVKQDILAFRQELTQDIRALGQELTQDIRAVKQDMLMLKQELKADLRELEHRVTLRMGTMLSVAVGVVAALVKLL